MATQNNTQACVRHSVLWRVVAVLAVAAIGSCALVAAPLAKYATTSKVDEASARVAKFAVTAVETDGASSNEYTLSATNTTATLQFGVQNADVNAKGERVVTEVPTTYDVILTLPEELQGVSATITRDERVTESGEEAVGGEVQGKTTDNKTFTFSNVSTFPAGTVAADRLTLTFKLDPDKATSATYTGIKLEAKISQAS